jgi:hypothetical protein
VYVMKWVVHVMKRVVYIMKGVVRVTGPNINSIRSHDFIQARRASVSARLSLLRPALFGKNKLAGWQQ